MSRTVLVASTSDVFLDIVGAMIEQAGFHPAFCIQPDPGSLSLARSRPGLVLVDCEILDNATNRLIAETLAHSLPLLMTSPRGLSQIDLDRLHLPDRTRWLHFPIGQAAFRAVLEGMLAPPQHPVVSVAPLAAWVVLEGAISVRPLSGAQR
jgi:hypothetical protein